MHALSIVIDMQSLRYDIVMNA